MTEPKYTQFLTKSILNNDITRFVNGKLTALDNPFLQSDSVRGELIWALIVHVIYAINFILDSVLSLTFYVGHGAIVFATNTTHYKVVLMTKFSSLCKKAMMIGTISFMFIGSVAYSSTQADTLVLEKGDGAVDQEKSQVLNRMTPKQQIDFSKQDLASRLGLDESAIKISGATPVNWRSGALGCPKPGMSYTDVLVPGVLIYLRVGNTAYRYHAIPNGQPFYCPKDRAEPPAVGPGAD